MEPPDGSDAASAGCRAASPAPNAHGHGHSHRPGGHQQVLSRKVERHLVLAFQLRHIHHRAVHEAAQEIGERGQRHPGDFEVEGANGPHGHMGVSGWAARNRHALRVVGPSAQAHLILSRANHQAAGRRRSVGGSIGIGRGFLELRPVLPHHQGVDRMLLAFAMHLELKPLREQRLQHLRNLLFEAPSGSLATTSNLSADIQSGPWIWYGFTPYAMRIKSASDRLPISTLAASTFMPR